jgi:hypothetical protein
LSSKLAHQAYKAGNAEVTKADDANMAEDNRANPNEAIEAEAGKANVAKDTVDTNEANEADKSTVEDGA